MPCRGLTRSSKTFFNCRDVSGQTLDSPRVNSGSSTWDSTAYPWIARSSYPPGLPGHVLERAGRVVLVLWM